MISDNIIKIKFIVDILRDLHVNNVMITENGNYRFIDTVSFLNTPEQKLGGEREYGDYSVKNNNNNNRDIKNSKNNNNFAKNNSQNENEAKLDNRETMVGSALRKLVGTSETRSGIYRTVEASNTAGSVGAVLDVEELEELESRGINPFWDKKKFQNELRKQAQKNGVWLDETYLDGKELKHNQKAIGTSEHDVYLSNDGKTITKLNNLAYVINGEHGKNLDAIIDRFAAHNDLFPNVAYTIKGFMNNIHGNPALVLEQPYIDAERNATRDEIHKFLEEHGFKLDGERDWANLHEVWSNGKYELFDARPANVLKGKDGNLYFFDTIPHSVEYMQIKILE